MADNTELMLTKLLSFQRSNPHVNYYGSQIFTGSEESTYILDQDIMQKTTATEDVSKEQQLLSQTSDNTIDNFGHNEESEYSLQSQNHFSSNLTDEVWNYPCLWDLKSKGFKNSVMKKQAWLKISEQLHVQAIEAENEFKRLRENFRKCLKKRELESRSGAEAKKLPTCAFFVELSFLRDSVSNRKSTSNVNVPRLSDSRSSSPFDLTQVSSGSSNEIAIAAPGMRNPSPKPKPSSEIIAASTKTRKRKEDDDPLNAALTAAIVKDINKSGEDTNDSDLLFL
ncbi:uncharacterized protein LOC124455802 [Xenia sp. Carnegie-2017]|uniref:uncharacterized protein LOC124455802 n=1 Tax=Xenia sp. Carnegie-2017 TaxID=2897299 RepID=UPI001F038B6D|nr:uncharacterized protein LOC124455802 [Xenia sp. Carnegie-2017]